MARRDTRTGGRDATTGVIPGAFALSVGNPNKPLPEGWTWTSLTDVARLESGHTPSRKHPEYWGGEIPWVGIRDATGNYGRVIDDSLQHTNQLGIENSSARVLPEGTVCLSRTASVGYVIVMGAPMATSQDFVNWVCGDGINNHFLKYVLIAERESLNMFSMGTTHQTIYFPEVKAFHVALPPRHEQDAIAGVLCALDDKIELNRRMNETLEAMARAIFRDWFVDFGPTRAKTEGRPPYLAPDLWSLFPDALDDEDKPVGWQTRPLKDFFEIVGGGTPKTSVPEYWDGEIPWFSVVDTPSKGSVFVVETEKNITERGLAESSARLIPAGTTVISARGTVGNLAMAAGDMAFNQSCYALRHTDETGDCFVYLAAQHMVAHLQAMAHGSVFSTITRQTFEAVSLAMPPSAALSEFEQQVSPFFQRIQANVIVSRTLAQTRDFLLPKLMSGEIRLALAEKAVEAVA